MFGMSLPVLSVAATTVIHPYFNEFNLTASELKLLPVYCKVKASIPNNDPRAQHWINVLGPNYAHLHHYCVGLLKINRGDTALIGSKTSPSYYYSTALKEFSYMERNASSDFKLWPALLVKIGYVHERLKDNANAEIYYQKSVNKYPEYKRGYMQLVDLYIKQNRSEEAEKLNSAALQKFGKRKTFMRRAEELRKLKGK